MWSTFILESQILRVVFLCEKTLRDRPSLIRGVGLEEKSKKIFFPENSFFSKKSLDFLWRPPPQSLMVVTLWGKFSFILVWTFLNKNSYLEHLDSRPVDKKICQTDPQKHQNYWWILLQKHRPETLIAPWSIHIRPFWIIFVILFQVWITRMEYIPHILSWSNPVQKVLVSSVFFFWLKYSGFLCTP